MNLRRCLCCLIDRLEVFPVHCLRPRWTRALIANVRSNTVRVTAVSLIDRLFTYRTIIAFAHQNRL